MIKDIQTKVIPQVAATEALLRQQVAEETGIGAGRITALRVLRRSIDARQRQVWVNLALRAYVDEQPSEDEFEPVQYGDVSGRPQVVVVGAGPGGLFAALRLIELGLRPVVIERGKDVHQRKQDLAAISRTQQVDGESNYCFGEGGAGAYSDGKLFTRSKKRGSVEKVLRVFCQHGASTRILADAHPHIGTDRLPQVIEAMRNTIIRCGGEVHFQTRMTRLIIEHLPFLPCKCPSAERTIDRLGCERVVGVEATKKVKGQRSTVNIHGPVILATGHSARDVYRYLYANNVEMEAKGIAVGVRLEHPAALIDRIQYHSREGRGQWLPAAEYSMVTQVEGRGVYSFCMCPGGFVIPAATGPEQIVVNGMSPASRGTQWSNSGMVVELRPEDLSALSSQFSAPDSPPSALAMMQFQEHLERLCWLQGNRSQTAPAQRMADFVNGRLSSDLPRSSYAPGIIASPLHFWLPRPVASRLQEAFRHFGRHSHGFLTNEAVVIGVETRTSSPLRILRDASTLQHVRLSGLFPCGEGAGYAGGIVSAAIDGERCAEQVKAMMG